MCTYPNLAVQCFLMITSLSQWITSCIVPSISSCRETYTSLSHKNTFKMILSEYIAMSLDAVLRELIPVHGTKRRETW